MPSAHRHERAALCRGADDRHRASSLACSRRSTARGPIWSSTLQGQAGQPSGARSAQRFRTTLATAQIALSMTLLACAGLFTKSLLQHQPRRPRHQDRQRRDVWHLAGAERLHSRSDPGSCSRGSRRSCGAMPGVAGVTTALVPAPGRQQLGQRRPGRGLPVGPGRRQQFPLQRGRRRLLPHDGRSAPRRPRVHSRRRPRLAQSRHRQRSVRQEVQSRPRRRRQAHGRRPRRLAARHRDRRPGAERQVQRSQARGAATLLPALPPGRSGRIDDVLRAHRTSSRHRFW